MVRSSKPRTLDGLLRQIVESLPGQVAYWDKDLKCRYANRTYFDYFSQTYETIIGIGMRELLGEKLFEQNKACLAAILRGEPQNFIRSIQKLDGSETKVQVTYVPDLGADGSVLGFYVSVHDVTGLKRVEEQLLEKEAELTELVARRDDAISWLKIAEEIAHVGHWRMSLPSGVMTWSDEMYRIHGVTPECYTPEMESALAFYCPEDRGRVQMLMERTLAKGLPYEDTARLVRSDGQYRHVRTRGMATQGSDGSLATIFGVFVDVTEQWNTEHALRVANDRLEAIAHMDGLTGISNRRWFEEALSRECREAARTGHAVSAVLIDVDHFKAFNDTYGHQSGDECLRAVADAIRSVARQPQDTVARYGGEEFVVLLPGTDRAGATRVAERARAAIEDLGKEHKGSSLGIVTISAGVGSMQAGRSGPENQRQLVAEADAMLYRAKSIGRNRVVSAMAPKESARADCGL